MANTIVTVDMVAKEALRIAHEKLSFIGTINRQYDASFGMVAGSIAKTGPTLRIKLPNQYTRRNGSRIMDVQDQTEETLTVVMATQDGVDMRVNSAELALDIDAFSQQHIEPAMNVLVSGIDGDCIVQATKDTPNFSGTAGTVVGASGDISAFTDARMHLNKNLAPKSERYVQLDSLTMGSVVNGLKTMLVPGDQIGEAFREGLYARNAMADWYENERTYLHADGTDHTTVTVNDAAIAEGDSVITTAGANVTVGTPFTIANVLEVHPETKQSYGTVKQFVITAINGNDWTIYPKLRSTGAKANINALPVNGAAITLLGAASTSYRRNLMYHKDAFCFVTADLPLMPDTKCVRATQEGLSLRVWQASDIRNDELLMRIDILYGFKSIRPEWACQITN